jgi:hypothetical protein
MNLRHMGGSVTKGEEWWSGGVVVAWRLKPGRVYYLEIKCCEICQVFSGMNAYQGAVSPC